MNPYTEEFYNRKYEFGARRSAKEVLPIVLELVKPQRVIDVGCGIGIWLSVLEELGVKELWGIDGGWVDRKALKIKEERFLEFDLTKPFKVDRNFDLVVSVEVAEHLPAKSARTFVDSLVGLGPVILFSAAIPYQGGVNHFNEQWPDYWVRLFQERQYAVIDCIRKKIWNNERVEWWYAQNIMIFAELSYIEKDSLLRKELECNKKNQLSIVHPRKYLDLLDNHKKTSQRLKDLKNRSLMQVLSVIPALTKKAITRRLKAL
jgi:SAM-dependent methyltransferase